MRILTGVFCVVLSLFSCPLSASTTDKEGVLLKFSDGRAILSDLGAINDVLKTIGVRLNRIELPTAARPLLEASAKAPLSCAETTRIMEVFSLSRQDVLAQARGAGREPVIPGGGSMSSGEAGAPPYPKVYDLKSMGPQDRLNARNKFGRLHVNSTDDGVGVDEVMTLVAGGPWTWYFLLKDNVVVELQMSRVDPAGRGWRLSYPGMTPHGGHFHAEDGLCIAYITGPTVWTMRYEAPGFAGAEMLGKNPWIDFNAH
jgi:hypothetical protein